MNELEILQRNTSIYRRQFLASLAACAVACEPKKTPQPPPSSIPASTSQPASTPKTKPTQPAFFADWKDLSFDKVDIPLTDEPNLNEERALVLQPKLSEKLPLLVALHGYGESRHGLEFGAKGWRDQYELDRVNHRLSNPPLTAEDVKQLITPERLTQLNASLQRDPYKGLIVACPYTPSLPDKSPKGAEAFSSFVVNQLLPRVQQETNCLTDRAQTGINGVSMGGRLSLLVGLAHPEVFGVIGSMQTAMRRDEVPLFVKLIKSAMKRSPFALRLLSSEGDAFLKQMTALHEELQKEKIEHSFFVTPGPHDYIWNQGPGAVEMLTWHERVARGLSI